MKERVRCIHTCTSSNGKRYISTISVEFLPISLPKSTDELAMYTMYYDKILLLMHLHCVISNINHGR